MKKSILLIVFLCSRFFLFSQLGLIAHYKMDGDAIDISGNQNHGVVNDGVVPTYDRFGYACAAMQFDGSKGYIEVPNSSTLSSIQQNLTIAVWYKLSLQATSSNNYWLTVLCKGSGNTETNENPHYRLQVQQNTNQIPNTCSSGTPIESSTISMSTNFTSCDDQLMSHLFEPEVWHFYALVYNGTQVTAYMDNKPVFTRNYTNLLTNNNYPLYIGVDEPGQTEYFFGTLDDLRIFNRALSSTEVEALFNETKPIVDQEEIEIKPLSDYTHYLDKTGCSAKVHFPTPTVTSNCGPTTIKQIEGPPPGSLFTVGKTKIVYEITTQYNYREVISFDLIIKDTIPPRISAISDTTFYMDSNADSVFIQYPFPDATDNCGIKSLFLVKGISSGRYLKEGAYFCEYQAEDINDNTSNVGFFLHIKKKVSDTIQIFNVDTLKNITSGVEDTLSVTSYRPNSLIILLDVSGSMAQNDKINILKEAVVNAVSRLRSIDQLGVVSYASETRTILLLAPVTNRAALIDSINQISAAGPTLVSSGLKKSYDVLLNKYLHNGNHQIYLLTDGLFSISDADRKLIQQMKQSQAKPIDLNIILIKPSEATMKLQKRTLEAAGGHLIVMKDKKQADQLLNTIMENSKIKN